MPKNKTDTKAATSVQRRVPRQQRSRDRYETILQTARELIAERGNDGVSMREIALAAEVPIASVYQYFSDKNALLWTLFSSVVESLEKQWDEARESATSVQALDEAAMALFDAFVGHCDQDPAFAKLWLSVQANSVLAELDHAFNLRIAESYTAKIVAMDPAQDREAVWNRVLLMSTLSSTALQLAVQMPGNKDKILDQFRALLVQSVASHH
tara:strand:+ start:191 stop:826 length:636 start_codon:yes stop_codon:yes gene_type:complete